MKSSIFLKKIFSGEERLEEILHLNKKIIGLLKNPILLNQYAGQIVDQPKKDGSDYTLDGLTLFLKKLESIIDYDSMKRYSSPNKKFANAALSFNLIAEYPQKLLEKIWRWLPETKNFDLEGRGPELTLLKSAPIYWKTLYTKEEITEFLERWHNRIKTREGFRWYANDISEYIEVTYGLRDHERFIKLLGYLKNSEEKVYPKESDLLGNLK